jgi:hypothetical protein
MDRQRDDLGALALSVANVVLIAIAAEREPQARHASGGRRARAARHAFGRRRTKTRSNARGAATATSRGSSRGRSTTRPMEPTP